MARYPGQEKRRWPLMVAVGLALALLGTFAVWTLLARAHQSSASAVGPCPGGQDDLGRRQAATCLVASYFALENTSAAQRDSGLTVIVLPGSLAAARSYYKKLDTRVAKEYAAVAATHIETSSTQPETDAVGQAWVAFVDSYKDGKPPLAQWWITSFDLRWEDGRWWLNGGVGTQVDATPPSAAAAQRNGFGPGWLSTAHG